MQLANRRRCEFERYLIGSAADAGAFVGAGIEFNCPVAAG